MIKDQATLNSERILVLTPTGRDGAAASSLLEQAGMLCKACFDIDELQRELAAGGGAALVTEEAFIGADLRPLFDWVTKQPPWSDFPFVVLTTHRDDRRVRRYTLDLIAKLRNVTLQERPIQGVTLVSSLQAALRARRRQYEAAKYLRERDEAAQRLETACAPSDATAAGSEPAADRGAREPDDGARGCPDAHLEY